ncbi:MAG: hypothetical protein K8R79_11020, partial [Calditrichales bacterium]|nr:hypothetical protein [Calditrichales bacterium]
EVDNLGAGGIGVCINSNGKTTFAYDWTKTREIIEHPDSGKRLVGIQIQKFHKIENLALKASEAFNFMGTIGWDIGLSETGPVIIEANPFYDCSYWQTGSQGPLISNEIANGLRARNFLTRWDKTKIYPSFNRRKIKA